VFTGLVRSVGRLSARREVDAAQRLVFAAELASADRTLGASVCVAGVCLTVVESDARSFSADAAFETLRRTTLGRLPIGAPVNLEPALRVGDPLGGHIVAGHVDGVGRVRDVIARGGATEVWIDTPEDLRPFTAPKGSICIDGTSLTINAADDAGFSVGLVPHTREVTTLGALSAGQEVTLEVDVIARYVARLVQSGMAAPAGRGLEMSDLVRAGFAHEEEAR
jgi:riboflavin synthase